MDKDDNHNEEWINSVLQLTDQVFQHEIEVMRDRFKDCPTVLELNMRDVLKQHLKITSKNFFFISNFKDSQFLTKIWWDSTNRKSYWLIHFGHNLEGPPKHTHGGAISTAIDQAVGLTAIFCCGECVTGSLNINFKGLVKTGGNYIMETWIEKIEGRSIYTLCDLKEFDFNSKGANGRVLSNGSANMIKINKDILSRL